MGLASAENRAYFAWQDTATATNDNQAEDVYFASYLFEGTEAATAVGAAPSGATWLIAGASLLLGMGLAMALSATLVRRKTSMLATR